jgi:hypothetical protein
MFVVSGTLLAGLATRKPGVRPLRGMHEGSTVTG